MDLAAELRATLQEFLDSPHIEIREGGGRTSAGDDLRWEVRGAGEKPLLHLWSEHCNLTRRVLAVVDQTEIRVTLAVERFGRAKPDRLELLRREFQRPAQKMAREEFCEGLRRILAEQFPDDAVESLAISADLEHSLSGNYARGVLQRGNLLTGLLAVSPCESPDTVDGSLTMALLWLQRLKTRQARKPVAGLRLIVPKGMSAGVLHRMRALHAESGISVYELDASSESLTRVDLSDGGNIQTWLVPQREATLLLDRAQEAIQVIWNLAPEAITTHPAVREREVVFRYRGLPFARWSEERTEFGLDDAKTPLTSVTLPRLRELVRKLSGYRSPLNSDARHPLYRAKPERWMEALIRADVTRVDPMLDPQFVYEQVFANAGGQQGILDLLCVTRSGRLAILELKASESLHLPLQAADYWLRIRAHQLREEFAEYGFFHRIELQKAPPLVYLVAPALRFHPSLDEQLRYLIREIEVIRVGLAESWRRGIRVVMRQ